MPKAILNGVQCPVCLVGEQHPSQPSARLILVRVLNDSGRWFSQCLVCAGLWDRDLRLSRKTFDEKKGWFEC